MAAPKEAETSTANSLDAELARLRAAGLSDDEITSILTGRRLSAAPSGSPGVAMPQAPVSGVMGNFSAIWTHARNIIPSMAAQIVLVFDTSAAAARVTALLAVIVKAAFVLIFAYAVLLEFTQLRASVDQTQSAARQAKIQADAMGQPMNSRTEWDPSTKATQDDIARLRRTHALNPAGGPCNPELAPFPPGYPKGVDNPDNRCLANSFGYNTYHYSTD